MSLFFIVSEI